MRAQWEPPRPPASADDAVLAAYRRSFAARRPAGRFWLPVFAAAVAATAAVVLVNVRPPAQAEYRPVAQPRIIVVSQGERP